MTWATEHKLIDHLKPVKRIKVQTQKSSTNFDNRQGRCCSGWLGKISSFPTSQNSVIRRNHTWSDENGLQLIFFEEIKVV